MQKRIMSLLLMAVLSFSLAACGNSGSTSNVGSNSSDSASQKDATKQENVISGFVKLNV